MRIATITEAKNRLSALIDEVKAGETVLVSAGGGGVGVAAIQLAKVVGARVLTTVGSREKADRTRTLGARKSKL